MHFHKDPYYQTPCLDCEDTAKNIKELTEHFEALLDLAYSKDPFDEVDIEICLDEIAHYLGVKLPKGDIQLERKLSTGPQKIEDVIESWKESSIHYFNQLIPSK